MALSSFLHLSPDSGLCKNQYRSKVIKSFTSRGNLSIMNCTALPRFMKQDLWNSTSSRKLCKPMHQVSKRREGFRCCSCLNPSFPFEKPIIRTVTKAVSRSYAALQGSPILLESLPAIGIVIFSLWGLGPFMRHFRNLFHKSDNQWKKSTTYFIMTSYLQPMLLWIGATLICRTLDPVVLPTEASQVVKQRLLHFVRSLSTVLALAYCLSSVIQQIQKFSMETNEPNDARNMGFQFAGKAVYTAVWVAAVSLFMELLGFSTQRWLTAGGLGTVLLTLAGREIFTNFLSSIMIHATRPFVLNEWIQTRIEGYDVSGTVEHVGWWSPTIIRGENREAVHIPNHKFTVNVVRNLSQKSHWRIKTHLAISHLDVNKINNIVADMRKVLAKNPHVEQQKLHRRVFLDNINPENQALLILVSCFVKTSHFEEYLCVKEAIWLDLLRVISHHRARLATPIRTMQRMYSDNNLENVPFYDSSFSRSGVANRPFMLIEPSYKVNGDDKTKPRPSRTSGDQGSKKSQRSTPDAKLDLKNGTGKIPDLKARETSTPESKSDIKGESASNSRSGEDDNVVVASEYDGKARDTKTKPTPKPTLRTNPKDEMGSVESSGRGLSSDKSDQKLSSNGQSKISSLQSDVKNDHVKNSSASITDVGTTDKVAGDQATSKSTHQSRKTSAEPPVPRPALDENIILGVALEGAKRTLPIEEEKASPDPSEAKASAALSAEKEKKDGAAPREAGSDEKQMPN